MTDDIRLKINDWWEGDASSLPPKPWTYPEPEKGYNSEGAPRFADEQVMTYPGEYRKTLDMNTCNVLVEASFRIDDLNQSANSVIAGKHDGSNGYQLHIRPSGEMVFMVSSDGRDYTLSAGEECKEGEWHHVLAEIDRKTGRMSIYLDGSPAGQKTASIPADASLSNDADFVVGKDGDRKVYFSGALDFLRVCKGTLADSKTTIDELYEWQTKGPVKYDFAGDKPKDNRDVGAIEMIKSE
jgi:hypothetical protein